MEANSPGRKIANKLTNVQTQSTFRVYIASPESVRKLPRPLRRPTVPSLQRGAAGYGKVSNTICYEAQKRNRSSSPHLRVLTTNPEKVLPFARATL